MLNDAVLATTFVEGWVRALMNELPKETWKNVGYAKADILFIAVAAFLLNEGPPNRLDVANILGGLAAKPSVQKAVGEFLSAEGAQWNSIYDKWENALENKFPRGAIRVWQGIATVLAQEWQPSR